MIFHYNKIYKFLVLLNFMVELIESSQVKLKRPKCPFYGFSFSLGTFLDSRGNQCPLKKGYSPCVFSYNKESPNWNECPYNTGNHGLSKANPGLLEKLKDLKIFPEECDTKGVRFGDWTEYILHDKPLPIEV